MQAVSGTGWSITQYAMSGLDNFLLFFSLLRTCFAAASVHVDADALCALCFCQTSFLAECKKRSTRLTFRSPLPPRPGSSPPGVLRLRFHCSEKRVAPCALPPCACLAQLQNPENNHDCNSEDFRQLFSVFNFLQYSVSGRSLRQPQSQALLSAFVCVVVSTTSSSGEEQRSSTAASQGQSRGIEGKAENRERERCSGLAPSAWARSFSSRSQLRLQLLRVTPSAIL